MNGIHRNLTETELSCFILHAGMRQALRDIEPVALLNANSLLDTNGGTIDGRPGFNVTVHSQGQNAIILVHLDNSPISATAVVLESKHEKEIWQRMQKLAPANMEAHFMLQPPQQAPWMATTLFQRNIFIGDDLTWVTNLNIEMSWAWLLKFSRQAINHAA